MPTSLDAYERTEDLIDSSLLVLPPALQEEETAYDILVVLP